MSSRFPPAGRGPGSDDGAWEVSEVSPLEAGTLLEERYEVVRLLGAGAMANVYLARHVGLNSEHAVKVLNPDLALRADLRNRFLTEGQIQAQLRHPNIVPVTDIVTSPHPGLVMEYVEGKTLAEWIDDRGGVRAPEPILEMMAPLLSAVGAAHAAGVVHRDLKPENILVGRSPNGTLRPMITDFGIARILEEGSLKTGKRKTAVAARMGTLHYMSPEQVRGAEDVGPASDIFSLGAILYELVTARVAFSSSSDFDTMKLIVEGGYEPPERVVGDLPPVLAACIRKALAVDPKERFASCAAFLQALEALKRSGASLPERPARSMVVTELPISPTSTSPAPHGSGKGTPSQIAEAEALFSWPPAEERIAALKESLAPRPSAPNSGARGHLPTDPAAPLAVSPTPAAERIAALRASLEASAQGANRTPPVISRSSAGGVPSSVLSPLGAAAINLILPVGLGQMGNGQVLKGVVVMAGHFVLIGMTGGVSWIFTLGASVIDAWMIAKKRQKGKKVGPMEFF